MPELKRRSFLQMIGAASFAPVLPALPTAAAATTGAMTPSQMLWASMSARAGTASNLTKLARSIGISSHVGLGISATVAQSQIVAHSVTQVTRAARPKPVTFKTLETHVERLLADDDDSEDIIDAPTVEPEQEILEEPEVTKTTHN